MANKLKAQNQEIRREIANNIAKGLKRQNPSWSLQQVNDAAFKAADLQIKQGVEPTQATKPVAGKTPRQNTAERDALALKWSKTVAKQNPGWTPSRVMQESYRLADDQMRRDAGPAQAP